MNQMFDRLKGISDSCDSCGREFVEGQEAVVYFAFEDNGPGLANGTYCMGCTHPD